MKPPVRPRSPLWMVVLSLVSEEPMHPYRMQALIKERGKDQIANVTQRNSVYQTIAALLRGGLIAVRETSRSERRPERTVYEITADGRRTMQAWMREVLSTPAREFSDFPAALSLVGGADPREVRALLESRMTTLRKRLDDLEQPVPGLPRLFLLESEYMAAVVRAQIQWLRAVTADLRSGRLTWDRAWLQRFAGEWAARSIDAQPTKPARRLRAGAKRPSGRARTPGRRARRR